VGVKPSKNEMAYIHKNRTSIPSNSLQKKH